jgi:hypothetical protein
MDRRRTKGDQTFSSGELKKQYVPNLSAASVDDILTLHMELFKKKLDTMKDMLN